MFAKMRAKKRLLDAFKFAGIYRTYQYDGKTRYVMPKIHDVDITAKRTRYVFTLANGIDPAKVRDNMWIFQQTFGKAIELDGKLKKYVLNVYSAGLPKRLTYQYDAWKPVIADLTLPIVIGAKLNGQLLAYDMDDYPHLLLSGETGSGKSSLLRVILTTLILTKSPDELRFVLGDMKRSEFGLYRDVAHVDGVYMSAKSIAPALAKVEKEMERRGKLLDDAEKTHVRELSEKLPYIIVAIDEVALLKSEKAIMQTLENISSIGRSLGVLLILSMQRPDHKLLDGKLKNNLTVRVSGRQSNENNSRIAGTPGAHEIDIDKKGRMIAVLDEVREIQAPFLEADEARRLLAPYKREEEGRVHAEAEQKPTTPFVFGQLDEEVPK